MHNWQFFPDFEAASRATADYLAEQIAQCLLERETCHVILPGGTTPQRCFAYLAKKNLAWQRVHWYPGDERCLPIGDAQRNDVMLEENLWSQLPDSHKHPVPAELGAEQGAALYRDSIADIKQFDIAFLGLGEDGHTASLFPDNPVLEDRRSVIPVCDSPKPPAERVSMSITTLAASRVRVVLAGGSGKAEVIKRIDQGELLPVNRLGDINWFVDHEAAAQLST